MPRLALIFVALLPLMAQSPGFSGMGGRTKVLKEFDKDADGVLNAEERNAARAHLAAQSRRGFVGHRGNSSRA